ncbi:MAG: 50S ribosomal protein L17 [Chlamydiia bacterium]|nr:50S ribosomal protein L17 [Chlamydiia bacterium]
MRHRKNTFKLSRTGSHRKALFANMLKSLIENERIETTVPKAKALKRKADKMITLAKKNTLHTRRRLISELQIQFNALTPKEARRAKEGDTSSYNTDRKVIGKLMDDLGPRFKEREGGYTRILRLGRRRGDNAETCFIEYLDA